MVESFVLMVIHWWPEKLLPETILQEGSILQKRFSLRRRRSPYSSLQDESQAV
jgi:hypothetical protein